MDDPRHNPGAPKVLALRYRFRVKKLRSSMGTNTLMRSPLSELVEFPGCDVGSEFMAGMLAKRVPGSAGVSHAQF